MLFLLSNSTGQMYFGFLSSLPLLTPATTVFESDLSSIYSQLPIAAPVRAVYPYDGRGFVGPKKKTIVGLLILNSL
jgi:hypothetical protein